MISALKFVFALFAVCFFQFDRGVDGGMENRITPPPLKDTYEYWFTVDYRLTMGVWEEDKHSSILYLNYTGDQKYYSRSSFPNPGCANYAEYTGNLSRNIIGEGRHRDVIAINDSIPGPPVIVYAGSTLIVHVSNLMEEPISIHWHGLDQRGTFFMDGVPPLTQCPIMAAQTFTYKFKIIDPPGTYWYHGHAALDLGNGLFGAMIVLDPKDATKSSSTQDLIAVVNDWFPEPADFYHKRLRNDDTFFLPDYEDTNRCYVADSNIVGASLGLVPWSSALINGRGWHNVTEIKMYADRLPFEEFRVESDPSKPIKFRLINAGLAYGLLFSVDEHKLTLVATDSADTRPVQDVDYVHLTPGERYDVLLKPLSATTDRAYAIRVRSMERFRWIPADPNPVQTEFDELTKDHFGFGWLLYDRATKTKFLEETRTCTKTEPCKVINCPFQQYPPSFNRTCINVEDLRWFVPYDKTKSDDILKPSSAAFEQYFLNYGSIDRTAASINRIRFRPPNSPPFMHQGRETETLTMCDAECGRTKECACSHHVNLTLGNTIELVWIDLSPRKSAKTGGFGHPLHLHGHHFHVLKQGWPTYDQDGLADQINQDIICDQYKCEYNIKNNSDKMYLGLTTAAGKPLPWHYTNDDGYKPVYKDTVHVPYGGYVIVRFKADNPGWWLSHCHILPHHANGMVMFFREGTPSSIPKPPGDFPTCGIKMANIRQQG